MATSTIAQALRAISVLLQFFDDSAIRISERIRSGKLLTGAELERLSLALRRPLASDTVAETVIRPRVPIRVRSVEGARSRATQHRAEISEDSAAIRSFYAIAFLRWSAHELLSSFELPKAERRDALAAIDVAVSSLRSRFRSTSKRNRLGAREGLTKADRFRVLDVTSPQCPDNPWSDLHAKYRNGLVIRLLLSLGLRRGELLGIKVTDFDFRSNELLIARRADDPSDPRPAQPCTKTNDRILPVDDQLAAEVLEYVLKHRKAISGSRHHDFLFVASRTGAPLSLVGLNKVFRELRERCPELPREVFPHILRHTWNEDFSERMDELGIPEDEEKKQRAYLMGWSEFSGMPAHYTRRHIRRKAMQVSMELQRQARRG